MNEQMQTFINNLTGMLSQVAGKIVAALLVLIIGSILVKLIVKGIRKSKLMAKADPTVSRFFVNFIGIALKILLVVSIIAILGVPMASVVTVIATAGAAIGLALQGSLSNLAGGIMILIFKPFRLGNYIETSGHSGTVADIGIFYTVLTTPDNKEITIPNGTIMANSVINYSIHDTRRLDLTFGVAYGTDVEKVKALLLSEAEKNEMVLKDPAPFARLTTQNDSSLDFVLRVWVKSADYWTVNFDMLEAVNAEFEKQGIEIPYNTMDINIRK